MTSEFRIFKCLNGVVFLQTSTFLLLSGTEYISIKKEIDAPTVLSESHYTVLALKTLISKIMAALKKKKVSRKTNPKFEEHFYGNIM